MGTATTAHNCQRPIKQNNTDRLKKEPTDVAIEQAADDARHQSLQHTVPVLVPWQVLHNPAAARTDVPTETWAQSQMPEWLQWSPSGPSATCAGDRRHRSACPKANCCLTVADRDRSQNNVDNIAEQW